MFTEENTKWQRLFTLQRDNIKKIRIKELNVFEGLGRIKADEVISGDICALVGIEGFEIGDTITRFRETRTTRSIAIDESTMSMLFTINNLHFWSRW